MFQKCSPGVGLTYGLLMNQMKAFGVCVCLTCIPASRPHLHTETHLSAGRWNSCPWGRPPPRPRRVIYKGEENTHKKVTRVQLELITTIAPCFEMIIFLGNFSPLHEKEDGGSGEL